MSTSDGGGKPRKRGPRSPKPPPDTSDWPSGYEIAGHHVPPLPEAIHEHVAQLKRQFDRHDSYDPVLRAIEYIGVARLQGVMWAANGQVEGLPPATADDEVMLPWWVFNSFVGALQVMRREGRSLDELLGLRGAGRGKSGWVQETEEIGEHLKRATEVRYLIEQRDIGKTRAIGLVAEKYGLSDDAVKKSVKIAERRGLPMPQVRRDRRPAP